ncbi:diguanylate cyclase [Bryobacter aggregatus]|uniref:GGDEF domain-containing response regulator n=1 Tax=Bryobacter aggregatus TaxID=360054 RepID=UPI0004E0DF2C|nr:diguanylate cyclase [Bryobacter aggregatus]
MKVLIADDSLVSRHMLEATVKKWGYEPIVACDGKEAWDLLQKEGAPQLAILDWVMPLLTGPEVCKLVRQQQRETYTYMLLLTSKNQREDLIEGMDAGADDYITKPFNHHELQVRLRAGRRIVELQAELLETQAKLRDQATHDALTKVYNRHSIFEVLERELRRGERDQMPIGVALLDIDFFKSVNDTYGHIAGDTVLTEAARRIKASIRSYDSIGRYGGEEFLIILPGCDEACTRSQSDRIRRALASEPMPISEDAHPDTSLALTASFGSTTALPGIRATPESLLRVADECLYEAKRAGRNRIVFRSLSSEAGAPAGV